MKEYIKYKYIINAILKPLLNQLLKYIVDIYIGFVSFMYSLLDCQNGDFPKLNIVPFNVFLEKKSDEYTW